jgi:phospholipid transport system transporter-binding protein
VTGNSGNGASFEDEGDGRFALRRELTFATVSELLAESEPLFSAHSSVTIDMRDVPETDSAGLALLVEWLSLAQRDGRELRYENLPAQILTMARISEVDDLIGAA